MTSMPSIVTSTPTTSSICVASAARGLRTARRVIPACICPSSASLIASSICVVALGRFSQLMAQSSEIAAIFVPAPRAPRRLAECAGGRRRDAAVCAPEPRPPRLRPRSVADLISAAARACLTAKFAEVGRRDAQIIAGHGPLLPTSLSCGDIPAGGPGALPGSNLWRRRPAVVNVIAPDRALAGLPPRRHPAADVLVRLIMLPARRCLGGRGLTAASAMPVTSPASGATTEATAPPCTAGAGRTGRRRGGRRAGGAAGTPSAAADRPAALAAERRPASGRHPSHRECQPPAGPAAATAGRTDSGRGTGRRRYREWWRRIEIDRVPRRIRHHRRRRGSGRSPAEVRWRWRSPRSAADTAGRRIARERTCSASDVDRQLRGLAPARDECRGKVA